MDEIPVATLLPVGGGKGGIGKSVMVAGIGSLFAQQGKRVVLLDADLGGANLHTLLGIRFPAATLSDYLNERKGSLQQILLDTSIPQAKLISGASDVLGIANPKYSQKEKIIRGLQKLEADYILLDLGAGTGFHTIDFFALSCQGIIVIDAELTTMENAYGFLKTSILRKLGRMYAEEPGVAELVERTSQPRNGKKIATVSELLRQAETIAKDRGDAAREWLGNFHPRLLINRVRRKEDVEIALRFCEIAKKYLSVEVRYVGYVAEDEAVRSSVRSCAPLVLSQPACLAVQCLKAITANLLALEKAGDAR